VYDTIIIGGGSAGSVMAHRLSARSGNKILLCEAGQDTPPGNEPPEIRDSYSGTAYFDPRWVGRASRVYALIALWSCAAGTARFGCMGGA
jgi:choline dehydrogenase-like flavoprotein